VVVPGGQRGDRSLQVGSECGTVLGRAETDDRVDGEGRQPSSRRDAGDHRPQLAHCPSVHRDEVRRREMIGDLVRVDRRLLQHVGSNDELPCRTPHEPFGDAAPRALLGQFDESVSLQRLQVVVHLLTSRADDRRDRGRRRRLRQCVEDRRPDRVERHLDGGSVSEHPNVVHDPNGTA